MIMESNRSSLWEFRVIRDGEAIKLLLIDDTRGLGHDS